MIKPLQLKKNKKAQIGIISFFFILFFLLVIGFVFAVGSAIVNWTFDEAVPLINDLGVIDGSNFTNIAEQTITPLHSIVQAFQWIGGLVYVMLLASSIFIMVKGDEIPRWLMGLYFAMGIMIIMGSIYMSNIYEDFYDDQGDLANNLKEQTILSFFILYSPAIFSAIVFITGVVLFARINPEEIGI